MGNRLCIENSSPGQTDIIDDFRGGFTMNKDKKELAAELAREMINHGKKFNIPMQKKTNKKKAK